MSIESGGELQPLIEMLKGQHGWVSAVLAWMAAVRVPMKMFSGRLQAAMTAKMAEAASVGGDEATDFEGVLRARWYRVMSCVLDLVCSLKLPAHADFLKLTQKPNEQAKA